LGKRLIIVVTITVLALAAVGFFVTSKLSKSGSNAANQSGAAKPPSEVQQLLDKAAAKAQSGELSEAEQIYSKFIEEHPDSNCVETAQKELEKVKMAILFSPMQTNYSVSYLVKPGDSLGKIAKQYNTTVELIKISNKLTSDVIHIGKKLRIVNAKFSILVNYSQNTLTLKLNDEALKVYHVSTGADNSTPKGEFKIVNKLVDPVWHKMGAVIPTGSPENILGSRWMGISEPGYGIHGTTQPESIGQHATAGCVRMINQDVEELYSIIPMGIDVTIVD